MPDADAFKNDGVRQQSLLFGKWLAGAGFDAAIAAPPECDLDPRGMHAQCVPGEKCKANGVDDFLARGGTLSHLVVLRRVLPTRAFDEWMLSRAHEKVKIGRWEDGLNSERDLLEGLSWCADPDGHFRGYLGSLAKVAQRSRRSVYYAASRLIQNGIVSVDRELALSQKQYKRKDGTWVTPFDLEDPPTFTIPRELRCQPDTYHLLKEHKMLDLEARVAYLEEREAHRSAVEEQADQEVLDELLGDPESQDRSQ